MQRLNSPLTPVLSRLVIPMIGLASVVLLATLYFSDPHINYPHIYRKVIAAIMWYPWDHPFGDWQYVVSAIECWNKSVDVYVHSACVGSDGPFIYSPLWLRLTFIRFADGWTNFFGLSFAVLFFVSLAFLPPRRTGTFSFLIMLFSAVSSATLEAVEQANADVVMFLMIFLGVLACGSRLPVRFVGYALITLSGLLKFYPMVALIMAIRERPVIFAAIALCVMAALAAFGFFFYGEAVGVVVSLAGSVALFNPLNWGAKQLPGGLAVIIAKISATLFHQDAPSAAALGKRVYDILWLLLIVQVLATAIWFGRRCRLPYAVAHHLSTREAEFLLAGAALISGCFFAGGNALYRAIYFLFVLPGLLTLAYQSSLQLARGAFRGTCVAIVFVLWGPFVRQGVRAVVKAMGEPVDWVNDVIGHQGLDRATGLFVWLCNQLAWWWIAIVLLSVLGALVLNSELWSALSWFLPLRRSSVSNAPSVQSEH